MPHPRTNPRAQLRYTKNAWWLLVSESLVRLLESPNECETYTRNRTVDPRWILVSRHAHNTGWVGITILSRRIFLTKELNMMLGGSALVIRLCREALLSNRETGLLALRLSLRFTVYPYVKKLCRQPMNTACSCGRIRLRRRRQCCSKNTQCYSISTHT